MAHSGEHLNCRDMVEYLSEYVDGELDAELRTTIERHGNDCPPCRNFIRTLTLTVRAVQALPREPLPPDLKSSLKEALLKLQSSEP